MEKEITEYAFPVTDGTTYLNVGMTLRDYFAAKAISGMVAGQYFGSATVAECAYSIADAMLIARKQIK